MEPAVTLKINHAPNAPASIACATSPLGGSTFNACTLTAASSIDVDGDSVTYANAASTCPGVVVDSSSGNVSFTAPTKGVTCLIKVKSYDGTLYSGDVTSATITGANHDPATPLLISCVTSPLGGSTGQVCTLTAASPADSDGDAVTYVNDGSTCSGVVVNSSTGNATFSAPAKGASCSVKIKSYDGTTYSGTVSSSPITGSNNTPVVTGQSLSVYRRQRGVRYRL